MPTSYRLELEPDLEASSFSGTVEIDVEVHEPIDELVLNAVELDIVSCQLDGVPARWSLDEKTERLHVTPDGTIEPGAATLHIRFRGTLNDKLRGFYRSTFRDDHGIEQVIATTQMEATDCRQGVPVLGRTRVQGGRSASPSTSTTASPLAISNGARGRASASSRQGAP